MSIEPDIELTVDEDIVLWHSISRGDKKAFDDFFMKYYALLYGYSRYYVSAEDAKEVLQELMMWLWENSDFCAGCDFFFTTISDHFCQT